MKNLNSVKVIFKNSEYNYTTDVSSICTELTAQKYFIGATFNIGSYPGECMQICIGIEFTDNNKDTTGLESLTANGI